MLILGGATGLLGQALATVAAENGHDVAAVGRKDFDPTQTSALEEFVDDYKPDLVCNTIAYTQVDKAEDEEEEAMLLNRVFPYSLARVIKARPSVHLMHFSTDFVFNGRAAEAYRETDPAAPSGVYGKSKLAGEKAIVEMQLEKFSIIRTAWLFGPGKKNFVSTILNMCAQGKPLSIVHDQTGSPTYTTDLAAYCIKLFEAGGQGIFHLANSGSATWCELAAEAVRLAQMECKITPVTSKEYQQKAVRPPFSKLDTSRFTGVTGIKPRPWPQALADYVYSTMSPA